MSPSFLREKKKTHKPCGGPEYSWKAILVAWEDQQAFNEVDQLEYKDTRIYDDVPWLKPMYVAGREWSLLTHCGVILPDTAS